MMVPFYALDAVFANQTEGVSTDLLKEANKQGKESKDSKVHGCFCCYKYRILVERRMND